MPVNPVSRLGRAAAALRSGRSVGREAAAGGGSADLASAPTTTTTTTTTTTGPEPGREPLPVALARQLKGLSLDTPQEQRQGVSAFVQLVLAQEFGDRLLCSPRYVDIQAEVRETLESDPQVHADLLALLRELKAAP